MPDPITIEDENVGSIAIGLPEGAEPGESSSPPPVPATPATPEDESQFFFQLDVRKIPEELARLSRERADVANTLFATAGQKTARRYQSQLQEKELLLQSVQLEAEDKQILSIPEEERNRRWQTEPEFRTRYVEAQNRDPNWVRQVLTSQWVKNTFDSIMDSAVENGLSADRVTAYQADLTSGKYDKDSDGNPISANDALHAIQRDVTRELVSTLRTPPATPLEAKAEPPAPAPTDKANSAITAPGPDTSSTGKVTASTRGSSVEAYQALLKSDGKLPNTDEIDALTAKYLTMDA